MPLDPTPQPSGPQFRVSPNVQGYQNWPTVAALGDGGFVVVWEGSGPDAQRPYNIYAQRHAANGQATGEHFVLNANTDVQITPTAAGLADGGFVVVWESYNTPSGLTGRGSPRAYADIYAQIFTAEAVAVREEFRVSPMTGYGQNWPSIVPLADGGFVVTWVGRDTAPNISTPHAQRYTAEGVAVSSGSGAAADAYSPGRSFALLADGGFVAVWGSNPTGSDSNVYAQLYTAGGVAVGKEFIVNPTTANHQATPSVAPLADGGFVVVWEGYGPHDSYNIYAQRYTAEGARAGAEFRINATLDYQESKPSVAALADGGFVVSWFARNSANSDWHTFAQVFTVPGISAGVETPSKVSVAADDAERYEGDAGTTDFTFTVSLDAASGTEQSVRWQVFDAGTGAAATVTDFPGRALPWHMLPSGTLVFAPGETSKAVSVAVAGDTIHEADESFAVQLSAPSSGLTLGTARATTTILDDDATVVRGTAGEVDVAANTASRLEGDAGATAFAFTVRLDAASRTEQSVRWQAVGVGTGAATAPDFAGDALPSGTLVFAPGETSKAVIVFVAGDTINEADESFAVQLSAPSPGLTLGTAKAIATILDDDATVGRGTAGEVSIAANTAARPEGDAGTTAFTFSVRMDAASDAEQSVRWQVAGAGANPATAADFAGDALPSGTLVFAPGETSKTVTVHVAGDAAAEADERFAVVLSDASAGLVLGAASGFATILDDDAAPPAPPAPPDMPIVRGTALDDSFAKVPGRAAYEGLGGRDVLDFGGAGFRGAHAAAGTDGSCVLTHGGDAAVLREVEEARFADGRLVFDANDPAAQVLRLYEAALDRLPDQGGLNFWIDAVRDGQPLADLARTFLGSAEFQARSGGAGTDNGAFVDSLYQNVLGRAGDAEGRKSWVDRLDAGAATRADVLAALSESAENRAATSELVRSGIWDRSEAAMEVARLYDAVFGRLPDAEGLAFWKGAMERGAVSLGQVADAFAGGAEFAAQHGALGDGGFVEALYANALDRPADGAGLGFWTGRLGAGVARSEVVLAFSESAEHVALTAKGVGGEAPAEFGILFA